jgi:hypothetical protein
MNNNNNHYRQQQQHHYYPSPPKSPEERRGVDTRRRVMGSDGRPPMGHPLPPPVLQSPPPLIPPPPPPRRPSSHHTNNKSSNNNKNSNKHKGSTFLSALSSVSVPLDLVRGVRITTVKPNGKTQAAILHISHDRFSIGIRPEDSTIGTSSFRSLLSFRSNSEEDNKERSIDIGEVDRIQRGQSTQQFEFAKKKLLTMMMNQQHAQLSSSNLLLGNGANNHPSVEVAITPTTNALTTTTPVHKSTLSRNTSTSSTGSGSGRSGSVVNLEALDPSLSFSVIFRGAQTVDIMAVGPVERDEICDALDSILRAYQTIKTRVSSDILLLRYVWLDVDRDKTGYVTASQVGKVLRAINFNMKQKDVHAAYDIFGKVIGLDRAKRRRGLTFEQSATFLHKIKRDSWMVKPVNVLWNELFGEYMNNRKMRTTVSDRTFLEKFLHGKQGQNNTSLQDVRTIFQRLHAMEFAHTTSAERIGDTTRINKDMFEAYLLASENDAFNPEKEAFRDSDMNQPLSEYFINSSHNTYLIGDQYTSQSSVEMYSNALYRGARCLELDIWDGPKSPTTGTPIPVVWHGHTMTTKIKFEDIIKTIKVFLNFHPDSYPIILSFENHCSIPYQQVMAQQLVSILGDSLYVPTEASLFGLLPSPNRLRGMVVIKGRRPDGTEADQYDSDEYDEDEYFDDDSDNDDGDGNNHKNSRVNFPQHRKDAGGREKVVEHGVAPELAVLTLFHGHKLKSFEQSKRTHTHFMHSFSESKVRSLCAGRRKQSSQWIAYNQTHMSRTYPAGSRVDSSNYNPLLAWSTGCQMVALNFQTQDPFLRLNDGRFRENGNCGYVLKPSSLMTSSLGMSSADDSSNNFAASDSVQLSIRVLSGSCLPKPKGLRNGDCIDPYVKVGVYDVKNGEKETMSQQVTGVVFSNGYFPIWSHETFTFTVENWSIGMLQVTVMDKQKEEFIASASIPIPCLRRGIRSVKLCDATNTRSGAFDFAALLLDIEIGQMVAEI